MQSDQNTKQTPQKPALSLLFIFIVWLSFFLLRLGGPPDLRAYDQERPASYIMDVVQNGHCICQRDFQNDISSKPPLYTWLAALTTIPLGRICRFSIYFPNALAVLITAVIIFFAGRRLFGQSTGCIAALFYMISAPGLNSCASPALIRSSPCWLRSPVSWHTGPGFFKKAGPDLSLLSSCLRIKLAFGMIDFQDCSSIKIF